MASTKEQAELTRLITKLTPANPQRDRASGAGRSGLGQALFDIATAVESAVSGGQYYANEDKCLSRKINELNSENQRLKSEPRLGPDFYARENRGLSRKINDLHHENEQLEAENTALSVENMTWKTFYAQVMAGGAFNQEPARPRYGAMNADRWQRMAPAAATVVPGGRPFATGPNRASLEREKAEHSASQYATAREQRQRADPLDLAFQDAEPREQRRDATSEAAANLAANESKKRSYSGVDAAPAAKVRKLDYGHPIVRQAVKATAWAPGDSRVTVPKFGETMFGRPGTADEHRRSESKENTKLAVPQLGEAMYGAPALGAPGTGDHRSMSEPKHDFQFTLPKTFGGPGAQPGRCSMSEPRGTAKLAVPKSEETSNHDYGSNSEPKRTSQLAGLEDGEITLGGSSTYGYCYRSEPKEDYKLAESRFIETMFGAPGTHDQTFKAEPEGTDEVL
ncbi:hypothetical protein LTR85_006641 [Meristemomyces frigidus]|nr:hypothetical protein LTR85_006641 [Meristemomyces frigidus]